MKQRLMYAELAPEAMAAMRSVEHYVNTGSNLEPSLLELVRLRASLMNGCEYCIGMHTHELTKRHEPEGRITDIAVWRDSDAYTQRERAALAWSEAVTDIQEGHASDEAYAAAREHFGEKELVDLTVAIASINVWNRLGISFRAEKRRTGAAHVEAERGAEDDGGKVSVDEEAG